MNRLLSSVLLIGLGLVSGYGLQPFVAAEIEKSGLFPSMEDNASAAEESSILYWVAPMDANYRRDGPGQSPMGMDLVPVYENEGGADGVVKISPIVQNNLGVRVDTVQKGRLERQIHTVGYIEFDEEKLFHLHTRVDGWVEKLMAKSQGEPVRKGQKMFELYSPTLVNAQEEYLTALRSKNQRLIRASQDRLAALGVSKRQIDTIKSSAKVQQRISFYAAQSGFIEQLNIREGMYIKPATEILSIGQLDSVWVIAEVFERQSGWVQAGQKVSMRVAAYPQYEWKGVLDYLYPVLEEKTRTLRVRIRFDNEDGLLKPNMFTRLTLHSEAEADTLLVKREAIIRNGQMERVVKDWGEGEFQSVPVRTGHENGEFIEILDGLEEGDRIVTSGQFLIDSESSLTASFARMEMPMAMATETAAADSKRAWVDGKVASIMPGDNRLGVEHDPVEVWGWPSMMMDFNVDTTVPLDQLEADQAIRFLVEKPDSGMPLIVEIEGLGQSLPDNQAWVDGTVLKLMPEADKVTLQHAPVDAWGWPAMMMDFPLAESVDASALQEQDEHRFLVQKPAAGMPVIIAIEPLDGAQ